MSQTYPFGSVTLGMGEYRMLVERAIKCRNALQEMYDYFTQGDDPSEDDLRDPDFWEHRHEWEAYWKVIDGARAALAV